MSTKGMQVSGATQPEAHEVPPGYKWTEVGIVPQDWKVKTLSALGTFTKGKGIKRDDVSDDGVACVRYGQLYTDYADYIVKPKSRIPRAVAENSLPLKYGDLLFAGSGETADEIGKCAAFLSEEEAYAGGDLVVLRPAGQNPLYLGHLLNHQVVARQKARFGQGDAVVHISARNLGLVKVPLPPDTREQDAIAEALSDVDGLLGALEALIAKRRAIKQAAMQQLLTGKSRLPGFGEAVGHHAKSEIPGDWQQAPLHAISSMHGRIGWQGLKQAEFTTTASDPFLITGVDFRDSGIDWDSAYHVSRERYDIAPQIQLRPADVLMTKDGTIGKLLYIEDIPYPGMATLNSHLLVFRPINGSYIPHFLFYQMSSRRFADHIEHHKSGSTFFGLSQEATGRFRVLLPSIDEQRAIATALSDMDGEIAALEARRDKNRAIKQGMMQQLLTGRVRLVKPSLAEVDA
jgi:type I restriction enzyme S subunit